MIRPFLVLVLMAAFTAGSASANAGSTRFVPLNFYEIVQNYKQSVELLNSIKHEQISAFYNEMSFNLLSVVEKNLHALLNKETTEGQAPPFPMPNVTAACGIQLAEFLGALTTKQYWALQLLDSFGKPPAGVLEGSLFWVGDYNECLNITLPTFNGKYCALGHASNFSLNTVSTSFKYGACMPNKCNENDIATIANFIIESIPKNISSLFPFLNKTLTENDVVCQPDSIELDAAAITAIIVISFLVGIVALGTLYDIYKRHIKNTHRLLLDETSIVDTQTQSVINSDEKEKLIDRHEDENETTLQKILMSFSAYTNTIKLFTISKSSDQLDCLNAVRFLSLAWVIFGHIHAFSISYLDNLAIMNVWSKRILFLVVSNAYFSVDNFFLLSGLLTCYIFMKEIEKRKVVTAGLMGKYYFHRIWRLTPPYMLIVMVSATLTKYLGKGPLYPTNGFELNECRETWWTNLLYINNFVHTDKTCLAVSWYMANDMQFHWISPIMVIPFALGKVALGVVINVAIIIVSIITSALIMNHYPGSEVGMLATTPEYYLKVYITPWCRVGPFSVGILLGYAIYAYKKKGQFKLRKDFNILAWIISITMLGVLLFGIYPDFNGNPLSRTSHILYQATSKTLWAVALGYIIFACISSNGGIVNKLLSLPVWTPLSRLSYSAYLFHSILLLYYIFTQERPIHFQETTVIYMYISTLTLAYACAYVVSLVFEVPLLGLEKFILHR